ncbi:hypothetical protein C8R44DRAFT_886004 [Mycena epipterygia]|nr:hypothetical protein C8R44DRAFT_886004 [Mycena epipterygia]
MSDQPAPFQDVLTPFSGAQDGLGLHRPADFILRSSDGVDFHVHMDVLKFVSDFFDTTFSFPQASDDPNELRRDGKSILVLTEFNAVPQRLLCFAYPVQILDQYTLGAANDLGKNSMYLP